MPRAKKEEFFPSDDYERGYHAGYNAKIEKIDENAYFVGVGYGKKNARDAYIGFNSADEREQFEKGVRENHKHFNAKRVEPLTWWERLFGVKRNRYEEAKVMGRREEARQSAKRASVELRKKEKQAREKKRRKQNVAKKNLKKARSAKKKKR